MSVLGGTKISFQTLILTLETVHPSTSLFLRQFVFQLSDAAA